MAARNPVLERLFPALRGKGIPSGIAMIRKGREAC